MPKKVIMPKQQEQVQSQPTTQSVVEKIKSLVETSISLTTKWEQNNQKWHKMRMRIKKEKSFPFVGCANLRMPTIETKLRKLKSALANVIFGIRPIVQVIPSPSGNWEVARKVEKFLDHLIVDIIKLKHKAVIAIDQALEKGFYLLKPFFKTDIMIRFEDMNLDDLSIQEAMWIFDIKRTKEEIAQAVIQKFDVDMGGMVAKDNTAEVERVVDALLSGKKSIKTKFQDIVCNYPDVSLCEPERVYVPTDAGFNPQDCSFVIHEFMMPIELARLNGEIKGWDLGEIANIEIKGDALRDKDIDTDKELREGIEALDKTGKIKIWEFYGLFDINNDGKNEKCVITIAPEFDKVLRKITLPFHSGKYPFVKLFYELTDDRWFAHRGIPELIEDIVKEIDIQHCQKIDQQTIRNTPQYIFRSGMVNPNAVQFIFGQAYPAQGMQPLNDLIAPLNNNNPNVEFSYEREQMILETKVEELIGQVDFTLQSMINKRQPRTLGEVQLQQQNMQMVFSLDAELFRMAFEELFNWIWELWCQYGDDSYEFMYFGREGWQPIKLTKEEIQGHYKITVRGNDQNTNPQVRIQKAQMIMMGMQNPIAIQTGVITPLNIANAYKRFYQELDIPNWEELISQPQPPQPQPQVKLNMGDMTDAEQAQVLAKQGIRPDVRGRALKSGAIIQEKQQEQKIDTIKTLSDIFNQIGGGNGSEEKG